MSQVEVRNQQSLDVGNYNYTRPRGPIAGQYASPGPKYKLPGLVGQPQHDFRSVHEKKPAWVFGTKHGKMNDDCSPGPAYLPPHKCYKDGKDGTPHYSLYSRNADLTMFRTPGPSAYRPECSGPNTKYMPPKYSFGTRHKHRRTDNTPGPNSYSLPNMTGKTTESKKRAAPNFSLTGRSKMGGFDEDLAKTPGPSAYSVTGPDIYKNAPPQFSMTSRNCMPGDGTQKPGPGAHSPENVYINKRKAPGYSFGMQHSQYTAPLIVDAPDDY